MLQLSQKGKKIIQIVWKITAYLQKTSKYKEVESLWITFNSTVFPQE